MAHGRGDGAIHRAMLNQAWLLKVVQIYSTIDWVWIISCSSCIIAIVLEGGRFLDQLSNIKNALLDEIGDESRVRLVAITVLSH